RRRRSVASHRLGRAGRDHPRQGLRAPLASPSAWFRRGDDRFCGRHLLRLRRAHRRVAFTILSRRPDRPLREKLMNKQSNIATALAAALCAAAFSATFGVADEQATTPKLELVDAQRFAPGFIGIDNWLNSVPLNIADLRGKVVLVAFWTYGCYNCVNTLPHVTRLYDTYRDKGLVVVGIHTPEFPFEKSLGNLQAALKRHGIHYPVAQDNEYATWNAYRNQYWPAQYIVDQSGKIVFEHAGEGRYEEIERAIQKLLNINTSAPAHDSRTAFVVSCG